MNTKELLDVADKMIDLLYRRQYNAESFMGGKSEAIARMTEAEKAEYDKACKQYQNLLTYRKTLLNNALVEMSGLTVEDGFQF